MRTINQIILHHTASDADALTWDQIRQIHIDRGWSDIGYHYGFAKEEGQWVALNGRPIEKVGAHAKGRNANSVGIVIEGNYETQPFPKEIFWDVVNVVLAIALQYDIKPDKIFGHREVASTLCPGRHFPLEAIRGAVADWLRASA